ncbi:universal stress protein [uncultured Winogradskyella sp.]|uniref:universal stress protein n=1 Tax=uncultured Winogradskyella sp. TaxID=395353 RepID=UPI0030DD8039|tara:strand:- start:63658 stop:64458 length:801 start_codon:yes stop_codon:yes gene_type:complete
MKNNKYKILVLSDLKEGTNIAIKNAVSLSKIISADIELFYVRKPTDIVERESQLSAMRTINQEYLVIERNIKKILEPISKSYDVKLKSSFAFGNVKSEIKDYIEASQPDIIVLGQRVSNPFQLRGTSITSFLLKEYEGIIVISSNNNSLIPNEKVALGVLNGSKKMLDTEFFKELIPHSKTPLKSFKIINSQKENGKTPRLNKKEMVEFVFEKNINSITTLSKYLVKNKINLLCVNRVKNTQNSIESPLKEVVNKLNISLLISRVL